MTTSERWQLIDQGMEMARDAFWKKAVETNQIVVVEQDGEIVELPARETQIGQRFLSVQPNTKDI
jgi:hypothetical protein